MNVLLANPHGFCAGVRMATAALNRAIELLDEPIYVFHEIVHNRFVVRDFQNRGVTFVDAVENVPLGSVLMFSAHGISPAVREAAAERNLRTIDATCPLVAKVHAEAQQFTKQGCQLVLIGHAGHDETVGILGEAPDRMHLVSSVADVDELQICTETPIAWLSQTTLSVTDTDQIVARLRERFPDIVGPKKDDICYATQNRQNALIELCDAADAVVVVGSRNSSNSQRLREVALQHRTAAILVDNSTELSLEEMRSHQTVVVTAGASAPEWAVEDVLNWFRRTFNAQIEMATYTTEEQSFAMPRELQDVNATGERIMS